MITYIKQDDTHAYIEVNEERIGWIEKHKLRGCWKLILFFDPVWIPFKEYKQKKVEEFIMSAYKSKRFEKYSEQRLIDRGFKIKG